MTFFYDLNKRLANLASKQDAKQISEDAKASAPKSRLAESIAVSERSTGDYSAKKAAAGKDIGKPGKNFGKIAKGAAKRYGSKAAGERVAGAVLNKLRHPKESAGQEDTMGWLNDQLKDYDAQQQPTKEGVDKKAFAKLAPPTDKITFADKIAGAKKEVDEMLGDVAAEAMKAALGKGREQVADEGNAFTGKLKATPKGGKFKLGNKEFTDNSEVDEGFAEMDAWLKSREKEKGTGKFDKRERTLPTGMKATTYTRKHEEEPTDDSDAPEAKGGAPKKRGRPMGKPKGPERVTGKAWKHKGGRAEKTAEDLDTDGVMMTRPTNCSSESVGDNKEDKGAIKAAVALLKKAGYRIMKKAEEELDEKAVSKKQQKFMGMVHAAQKGEKPASKEVAKVAKEMPKKAAKDFASTKQKGLPEKVKAKKEESEEVEETAGTPKKAKSGYNFGGSVYEGFNKKLENMINEDIKIVANEHALDGDEETLTVVATGPEVHALKELLKMAGLTSQADATCDGCGHSPCECDGEMVDENSPDWPTNTETSPDALQYSGGLNKPKSTGQTTIPVVASQLRRQVSMEENVELERSLFKLYKDMSGK